MTHFSKEVSVEERCALSDLMAELFRIRIGNRAVYSSRRVTIPVRVVKQADLCRPKLEEGTRCVDERTGSEFIVVYKLKTISAGVGVEEIAVCRDAKKFFPLCERSEVYDMPSLQLYPGATDLRLFGGAYKMVSGFPQTVGFEKVTVSSSVGEAEGCGANNRIAALTGKPSIGSIDATGANKRGKHTVKIVGRDLIGEMMDIGGIEIPKKVNKHNKKSKASSGDVGSVCIDVESEDEEEEKKNEKEEIEEDGVELPVDHTRKHWTSRTLPDAVARGDPHVKRAKLAPMSRDGMLEVVRWVGDGWAPLLESFPRVDVVREGEGSSRGIGVYFHSIGASEVISKHYPTIKMSRSMTCMVVPPAGAPEKQRRTYLGPMCGTRCAVCVSLWVKVLMQEGTVSGRVAEWRDLMNDYRDDIQKRTAGTPDEEAAFKKKWSEWLNDHGARDVDCAFGMWPDDVTPDCDGFPCRMSVRIRPPDSEKKARKCARVSDKGDSGPGGDKKTAGGGTRGKSSSKPPAKSQILKSEAKKPKKGAASSSGKGHSAKECTASRTRKNVKTTGSTTRTVSDIRPLQADSAGRHDGSRKDIDESAADRIKAEPACIPEMADQRRNKSDAGAKKKRSRGEEEGSAIQPAEDVPTGQELKKMKPSVSESGPKKPPSPRSLQVQEASKSKKPPSPRSLQVQEASKSKKPPSPRSLQVQ